MPTSRITSFTGKYRFLSNFYPCTVVYEDMTFPSVEHAYVAAKSLDMKVRQFVTTIEQAGDAKRYGGVIEASESFRPDWHSAKLAIMEDLLREKFLNPNNFELTHKLLETGQAVLIEGNQWGDKFWGFCNGEGHNYLGKLLMTIRSELQQIMNLRRFATSPAATAPSQFAQTSKFENEYGQACTVQSRYAPAEDPTYPITFAAARASSNLTPLFRLSGAELNIVIQNLTILRDQIAKEEPDVLEPANGEWMK